MHTPQGARRLFWNACYNVRDLGGYPTSDGTQTRWRSFVRADTMCRLTADGRAALLDYGVRTVIDLRRSDELRLDPNPFAAPPGQTGLVTYLNLPLGAGASIDERAAVKAASETTLEGLFCAVLGNYWRGIAAILAAITSAPEGGVLLLPRRLGSHRHRGSAAAGAGRRSLPDDRRGLFSERRLPSAALRRATTPGAGSGTARADGHLDDNRA
jgi:hypothetical protein